MTEVWEEKLKSGSANIEDGGDPKKNVEKNAEKDTTDEKMNVKDRTCHICGKVFKSDNALKIHGRRCKGKKEKHKKEEVKGKVSKDIEEELPKLRERLTYEMKAIKEEQRKLEKERSAFKAEIRKELEKLREERSRMEMRPVGDLIQPPETSDEGHMEIYVEEKVEDVPSREHGKTGVVVLEGDEESEYKESIDEMEEELARIEPEIAGKGKEISAIELDEISAELEDIESELSTKVDFEALTRMSEDYGKSIKQIEESLDALNRKIDGVIKEIAESAKKYGTYYNVVREIERLDDKTTEILEEIGFGESLNVTKIPPNILEIVYESTIESVVTEINRNYGSHDAENIIIRTLEDVRTRTSGSELFYFDGRMLKTRNLAKAIEQKLISAKQVQTTYDELLKKLLEYLPGYKARNFRAMIKLKSQEYAVDKTTLLLESIDVIREHIDNLKNMVGSVSNRQNSIEIEINRMSESKIGRKDVEELHAFIEEIKVKQGEFGELLGGIKEEQARVKDAFSVEIEGISKKLNEFEKTLVEGRKKSPTIRPEKKGKKKEDKKKTISGVEDELSEDEIRILSLIPSKGSTLSRIKKEIKAEMTEGRIEECLQLMMNKGIVSTVKRGRYIVYIINKKPKGGEE
jgi:DNA repair exonuclease SbcCD ATPase subunit